MEPPAAAYRVFPSGEEGQSDVTHPALLSGGFSADAVAGGIRQGDDLVRHRSDDKGQFHADRRPSSAPMFSSAAEVSGIGSFPFSTSTRRVCPPVLAASRSAPVRGHRNCVVQLGWKTAQVCSAWSPLSERRTSSTGRSVRLR